MRKTAEFSVAYLHSSTWSEAKWHHSYYSCFLSVFLSSFAAFLFTWSSHPLFLMSLNIYFIPFSPYSEQLWPTLVNSSPPFHDANILKLGSPEADLPAWHCTVATTCCSHMVQPHGAATWCHMLPHGAATWCHMVPHGATCCGTCCSHMLRHMLQPHVATWCHMVPHVAARFQPRVAAHHVTCTYCSE